MERAELARLLGGKALPGGNARKIICESEPTMFTLRFADAVAGEGEVFVTNPEWGASERAQFEALLSRTPPVRKQPGWLMIPTGGSSGALKFARHDSQTIAAAIAGFTQHFDLRRVNAVNVLPLFHVSGLMAWLRSAATGGEHLPLEWRSLVDGALPALPAQSDGWVISLVPTQLERLLSVAGGVDWLRAFRVIFVGGGPSWADLLQRARTTRLPIAPTYGMTETAAMVAGLRPGETALDVTDCGVAMPHAQVSINDDGAIVVSGDSVFRGYFPERSSAREFVTEDEGAISVDGRLRVLGRRDGVIVTGGEKVQPLEVEAELRATGEFSDVAIVGRPHPEWGMEVVAAFAPGKAPDLDRVRRAMGGALAPYKRPKAYVRVDPWPVSAHGKLNRAKLAAAVESVR